jgi:hypothetical protein
MFVSDGEDEALRRLREALAVAGRGPAAALGPHPHAVDIAQEHIRRALNRAGRSARPRPPGHRPGGSGDLDPAPVRPRPRRPTLSGAAALNLPELPPEAETPPP